jgi:hypothetical protein
MEHNKRGMVGVGTRWRGVLNNISRGGAKGQENQLREGSWGGGLTLMGPKS